MLPPSALSEQNPKKKKFRSITLGGKRREERPQAHTRTHPPPAAKSALEHRRAKRKPTVALLPTRGKARGVFCQRRQAVLARPRRRRIPAREARRPFFAEKRKEFGPPGGRAVLSDPVFTGEKKKKRKVFGARTNAKKGENKISAPRSRS